MCLKDVSVLTAMTFDLDKKTAEAVANLAGLDILAIAYKKAGKEGWCANRRAMPVQVPQE